MHKGKYGPFHPTYWATECCFWPNYIPWKTILGIGGFMPEEWSLCEVSDFTNPSGPGEISGDRKTVVYTHDVHYGGGPQHAYFTVALATFDDLPYMRLQLEWTRDFLPSLMAYRWRSLLVTGYVGTTFFYGDDTPAETGLEVNVDMTPANYFEGGSPWPPTIGPP